MLSIFGIYISFQLDIIIQVFFNDAKWSIYCAASGEKNQLFSMAYEIFINWYEKHDLVLDYYMTDYIILYIYKKYKWARTMVDELKVSVIDAYWVSTFWNYLHDKYKWERMISENKFQKLNWRLNSPKRNSVGEFFLTKL